MTAIFQVNALCSFGLLINPLRSEGRLCYAQIHMPKPQPAENIKPDLCYASIC